MENPKVMSVKLGTPPEGSRTIVWNDALKERTMIVKADADWDISIAIDNSGEEKETFCVAKSADGDGLRVVRMRFGEFPKSLEFSGDAVDAAIGGSAPEMSTNEIVDAVRGSL